MKQSIAECREIAHLNSFKDLAYYLAHFTRGNEPHDSQKFIESITNVFEKTK